MSLAFDENGRPFIILREQEKKKRVKGLEAHKVSTAIHLVWFLLPHTHLFIDQYYGGTHCRIAAKDLARS